MIGLISRNIKLQNPKTVAKDERPWRFGILGAARIGPAAMIRPARSHPRAVVAAVAARSKEKAQAYAKMHLIPLVLDSYEDLVKSPEIDVVYVALANGLHYEWTMRALEAGKHVLLEKPCASNAKETKQMFDYAKEKNFILMEAYHHKFYPALHRVKEIVDSGELGKIRSIYSDLCLTAGTILVKDDFRWYYDLAGGATMDLGVYTLLSSRYITSADPIEITEATSSPYVKDSRIDRAMVAKYVFPSDITAETLVDIAIPPSLGIIPTPPRNFLTVKCEYGEVKYLGAAMPHYFHSISVKPTKGSGRTEKVYKPKDGPGEEWWSSYRYMLESFIDKLDGKEPKTWITADESVTQMEWIDATYLKAGLPLRPSSTYVPANTSPGL
ncbi:NAD(P)-binding protein [Flammula alnicola]|nr:NAD(P)-binding protein [Flammula alnicola]